VVFVSKGMKSKKDNLKDIHKHEAPLSRVSRVLIKMRGRFEKTKSLLLCKVDIDKLRSVITQSHFCTRSLSIGVIINSNNSDEEQ